MITCEENDDGFTPRYYFKKTKVPNPIIASKAIIKLVHISNQRGEGGGETELENLSIHHAD